MLSRLVPRMGDWDKEKFPSSCESRTIWGRHGRGSGATGRERGRFEKERKMEEEEEVPKDTSYCW